MRLALIGLGKMGANMARRLLRGGVEVVGYNRSPEITRRLAADEGLIAADSLAAAVGQLSPPRVVWLMLPSGTPTADTLEALGPLLEAGDLVVDGGNANYRHSLQRAESLSARGIDFVDAGVSGGVWGLEEGYCLMLGGGEAAIQTLSPALQVLAPAPDRGWAHVGPPGAGHYTKMIHNGIEYALMQAYAEGFALMRAKQEFGLDLARIAELWRHGSVVRSWLLDLTAGALAQDTGLEGIAPVVPDSGEGRWTAIESVDLGVAAPVINMALHMRFASQGQADYGNRLLARMRQAFGGHPVKTTEPERD